MALIDQIRRSRRTLARDLSPPLPITAPTGAAPRTFTPRLEPTTGLAGRAGPGPGQTGGLEDLSAVGVSPRVAPSIPTTGVATGARGVGQALTDASRRAGVDLQRPQERRFRTLAPEAAAVDREGLPTAAGQAALGRFLDRTGIRERLPEARGLRPFVPPEERRRLNELAAGAAASPAGVPTIGPEGPDAVLPGLSGAAPEFGLEGVGPGGQLQPFGIGEQLAATFDPLRELAREQLSAAELALTTGQPEIEKQLETEKESIRSDVAAKFAPQFERISEEEKRQVETARRTSAAAGSARGTRAAEFEVGLRDNAAQRREALDAQRRLEERAAIAAAEGASAEQLSSLQAAANRAAERVATLGQEAALLEQGLNQELIKQAEQARQFDLEFQLKAQDALTNAFKAETGRQKVDADTQVRLGELATKIPEGEQIQLGEFTITGLKPATKNLQVFQVTDSAGNFKLVTIDKNSGETAVQDLGNVAGAPAVAGAGGGGGGFGGGGTGGGFGGGGTGGGFGGGGTGGGTGSGGGLGPGSFGQATGGIQTPEEALSAAVGTGQQFLSNLLAGGGQTGAGGGDTSFNKFKALQ